jgi:Domain of Unknown Function (DUF1080)/FG-GAP-like repeat
MSFEKTTSNDELDVASPGSNRGKQENSISRREFVTLAAAGTLMGNPAYSAAKDRTVPGDPLSNRTENEQASHTEGGLSPVPNFMPDWTFQGSSLSDWQTVGDANWRAEGGMIVGNPTKANGGWLILNTSLQDVQFFARMRSTGIYNAGVLLRIQKNADGIRGIFVSLKEGDLKTYRLILDANGRELRREALPVDPLEGRFAFSAPQPEIPDTPLIPAGGGEQANGPYSGPPWFGIKLPTPLPDLEPPTEGLWRDKWNEIEIAYDADVARSFLNNTDWQMESVATDEASEYGPIALYVGGTAEVQFKDVSYKNVRNCKIEPEKVSSNFRKQSLDEFYYSWGAAVADLNRDGHLDVIAGPYYYLGPHFTERREIYLAESFNPSNQYAANMVTHAHDFHGNGWPDILATEFRAMSLYVNPRGESRRWKRYAVVPEIESEITVLEDVDGDGRPELVYTYQNTVMYAKYDPADPTKPWEVRQVSEQGPGYLHGLGVGDIKGNGQMAILGPAGWWEPPAKGSSQKLWTYHPTAFGRCPASGLVGGGQMYAYDVNGDGLNDVVTSLGAHSWGLAWYEQKRDASGNISFERHMIMDNFSTKNAGGVTFSELHALTVADVDGDGIPDIITGKRYLSHLEGYSGPDPYGPAVLYCYHTVRDSKAPGGARFVPELIDNRSGVGSQLAAADLNKDGAIEIITATDRGNFIFWGKPRTKPA